MHLQIRTLTNFLKRTPIRHKLPVNTYTERTHTCGQLSKSDIGKQVSLCGWVQHTRFDNKLIILRDSYGITQCIVDKKQLTKSFKKVNIHNESVIQISGTVIARPEGQENKTISTGDVEILTDQVNILSNAKKDLPILTRDYSASLSTTSANRLKYRYLDLRSSHMQHALRLRSQICRILRNKLCDLNFVECETPTLYNRTPGGANEFIVPTQLPNQFYSLVQSPQQLKQLLMIGGLDRYFQICRCYRDESGRSDRQPEFTQVDIEMSFTNQNLIMELVEELLYHLVTNISDDPELTKSLISSFGNDLKIRRISFHDAFERYGTDKPDTRFDWLIESNGDSGLCIKIPLVIEDNQMLDMIKSSKTFGSDPIATSVSFEASLDTSELKVSTPDRSDAARKLLGALRIASAKELEGRGKRIYNSLYEFLWVTEFPLFTIDEHGKLAPSHHPFTAPTQDSSHLLKANPLEVIGQHYDLVLNGQEVAGGSIRIHDAELQKRIFTEVLGVNENTFDYFTEALSSGCPPHGGIAIGLDRLVAILLNRKSIKDVIAFPKSSTGRDLMTDSPHEIGDDVKKMYHIR